MNKKQAVKVWEGYMNRVTKAFSALDNLDAYMKTDKYRMMSDFFGENEENYCHRKDFQEFLDDLPECMN